MSQLPGFVDKDCPTCVCRLHKSLYGLKQVPRTWYQQFSSHLCHLGFLECPYDASLFVYHRDNTLIIILIYVDDIILTGNSSLDIHNFAHNLQQQFDIKHLCDLDYFLGMKVEGKGSCLWLSQSSYTIYLLFLFGMDGAKPIKTPMSPSLKLSHSIGDPHPDHRECQQLMGALQYLALTQPDISYYVGKLCQFMHAPWTDHLVAANQVLWYMKGTLGFGLRF